MSAQPSLRAEAFLIARAFDRGRASVVRADADRLRKTFEEGQAAGREGSRVAFVVGFVAGVVPTLLVLCVVLF